MRVSFLILLTVFYTITSVHGWVTFTSDEEGRQFHNNNEGEILDFGSKEQPVHRDGTNPNFSQFGKGGQSESNVGSIGGKGEVRQLYEPSDAMKELLKQKKKKYQKKLCCVVIFCSPCE